MTKDKIKQRLINYLLDFRKNSGTFKSFEIIYNYINFIESEPYLKWFLNDSISYIKKQVELTKEIALNEEESEKLLNREQNILDPSSFKNMPIFTKTFDNFSNALEEKREVSITAGFDFYLFTLMIVFIGMEELKKAQQEKDLKRVEELKEEMKKESFNIMPTANIKGLKEKPITTNKYFEMCIELINKHIIDEIDSQMFLDNQKPKERITFDAKESILYIDDFKIKIARKNDKPLDHFILDAIFKNEDLSEQIDFTELSSNFDILNEDRDWSSWRHACDHLNEKIRKDTDNRIIDFIKYTTGNTGWCKINPKHL